MEAVVSTTDLAEELGVTPETVTRWIMDGRLRGAFKRRGRWRIPTEEAEAFADHYGGDSQDTHRRVKRTTTPCRSGTRTSRMTS